VGKTSRGCVRLKPPLSVVAQGRKSSISAGDARNVGKGGGGGGKREGRLNGMSWKELTKRLADVGEKAIESKAKHC